MKQLAWAIALLPTMALGQDLGIKRCVNLGDALETPAREGEWGYVIEDRDITLIAEAGFDAVRLPVRFSTRWDGRAIDPAFLARVDDVIKDLLAKDLKVILDLHHFEELMEDPATHADTFRDIWAALGDHYAGWPETLYFELLNEPTGALTTEKVVPMFHDIIADLRAEHPTRWIILEGGDWGHRDELAKLPDFGPFTAHSFHYYDPHPFTHQQLPYTSDPFPARNWALAEGDAIRADIAQAAAHPAPLFLGEFGTYRAIDTDSRLAWLKTVRLAAEAEGIGWCAWSFASNFGLVREDKDAWLPGIVPALGLTAQD